MAGRFLCIYCDQRVLGCHEPTQLYEHINIQIAPASIYICIHTLDIYCYKKMRGGVVLETRLYYQNSNSHMKYDVSHQNTRFMCVNKNKNDLIS